jgi:hypothetical protein
LDARYVCHQKILLHHHRLGLLTSCDYRFL